jgi:hypothetical protein
MCPSPIQGLHYCDEKGALLWGSTITPATGCYSVNSSGETRLKKDLRRRPRDDYPPNQKSSCWRSQL